ncbi:hypothetical protein CONPUDRAFT_138699 [Coniophora puteana RWD-64-598 SS2]|uniref:Uncharacterized protein n=1 Tax=Coniophora puteana (strain RWD-64-598) TaxID=741705 RepID=A0A5M3MHC2_CONPW|nr:uncharacterized protein CONPUDRAFT_138699 [Coniophora puteana RWD-64-598 SS2]EIW78406.1 hypothetical protein CONPUDRAFT_138699 [Coniophora puteana RWD-64-598 SS2]
MDNDTDYVLPIGNRRRRDALARRAPNVIVLPAALSSYVVNLVVQADGEPALQASILGRLAGLLTHNAETFGDIQQRQLFDANANNTIFLAWQLLPEYSRFRSIAVTSTVFWIHTDVNRALMLAEFLLWFKRVYCRRVSRGRQGLVRVGYVFVAMGIVGVLLCDEGADLCRSVIGHGVHEPSSVTFESRVFSAMSSVLDATPTRLRNALGYAITVLSRFGGENPRARLLRSTT